MVEYGFDDASVPGNGLIPGHEITPGPPIEGGYQSPIQAKWVTHTQDYLLDIKADQVQQAGQPSPGKLIDRRIGYYGRCIGPWKKAKFVGARSDKQSHYGSWLHRHLQDYSVALNFARALSLDRFSQATKLTRLDKCFSKRKPSSICTCMLTFIFKISPVRDYSNNFSIKAKQ